MRSMQLWCVESITANIVIIGGGPAGLMAAEVVALRLQASEHSVHLFDAMPSVGRKFLLAGRGGLNITHAEALAPFLSRYGPAQTWLAPMLKEFGAEQLRAWVHGLGIETFVGSSQRVFPKEMKAAPLLRAWLHRLRSLEVQVHTRHRLLSWEVKENGVSLMLEHEQRGLIPIQADACLLALGGASWPRLGSDGAWQDSLAKKGVEISPLRPANCGFGIAGGWSEHLRNKFAGQALKAVRLQCASETQNRFDQQGEFVITQQGIEGSLVYAASRLIRERIEEDGVAKIGLDMALNRTAEQVQTIVEARPAGRSLSTHLQKTLSFTPLKTALLYEVLAREVLQQPAALARAIKSLPLRLDTCSPLAQAISSAGGIRQSSLTEGLMLRQAPGVFCAGEMLDWEAPTGGYLLTACVSSGRRAAEGLIAYLGLQKSQRSAREAATE
jgi:uncharacterized flavoprotein (TIGR03862 family)